MGLESQVCFISFSEIQLIFNFFFPLGDGIIWISTVGSFCPTCQVSHTKSILNPCFLSLWKLVIVFWWAVLADKRFFSPGALVGSQLFHSCLHLCGSTWHALAFLAFTPHQGCKGNRPAGRGESLRETLGPSQHLFVFSWQWPQFPATSFAESISAPSSEALSLRSKQMP